MVTCYEGSAEMIWSKLAGERITYVFPLNDKTKPFIEDSNWRERKSSHRDLKERWIGMSVFNAKEDGSLIFGRLGDYPDMNPTDQRAKYGEHYGIGKESQLAVDNPDAKANIRLAGFAWRTI